MIISNIKTSNTFYNYVLWLHQQVKNHPLTQECPDLECSICGIRDCPSSEPFHYHHDGCPCCDFVDTTPGIKLELPEDL